jgi:uncharacterized protein YciI
MYIITLTFAENRTKAGEFMEGHKAWIEEGFADGVFVLVGNLQPNRGGGIVAHAASEDEIADRVAKDPFVAEGVVEAQIIRIDPARTDPRLGFLAA